ncbi:hypothetical protein BGZ58_007086 [Dissophora ornata]|nr:hypothetical protein BGZ58_007086 [Dissophora ornata]
MESYPNPYSAVIANFNKQSPAKGRGDEDDEDDPQNLPDDDLLLWANAQFTFDSHTDKDLEDEMALKIAQNQQRQYQAQQQAQQQQAQQQQQQQQQQHQQQLQSQQQFAQTQQHHAQHAHSLIQPLSQPLHQQLNLHHHHHQQQQQQQQQAHAPQYHPSDVQRQLQQFDAIHGYLDVNSEDPRTSLSLVERSRQRNPVPPTAVIQEQQQQQQLQQQQQQVHYDPRVNQPAYAHQPAAHLRQPALPSQQFQPLQPYAIGTSPLSSPTAMYDYSPLQIHPHQQHHQVGDNSATNPRDRNNSVNALSSLSLSPPTHPAHRGPLSAASHEEKLQQLENELEEYQSELAEERKLQQLEVTSSSSNAMDTDEGNGVSHFNHSNHFAGSGGGSEGIGGDGSVENDDGGAYTDGGDGSNGSPSRSRSNSLLSRDDPDYAMKIVAEEDKRRRNTAASARFRQKKRLREQILERTAKEMTAKSDLLEVRVKELEMEIKWLRGLIVEKDATRVLLEGKSSSSSSSASSLFAPSSVASIGASISPSALINSNRLGSGSNTEGSGSSSAKAGSRRRKA